VVYKYQRRVPQDVRDSVAEVGATVPPDVMNTICPQTYLNPRAR